MDNASYLSTWDIDQLVDSNEITISVGAGATFMPTINSTTVNVANVNFPVCEVNFKAEGQSVWHQAYINQNGWDQNDIGGNPFWPGLRKTNGVSVEVRINANSFTITVCNLGPAQTVTLRYYVWSDSLVW